MSPKLYRYPQHFHDLFEQSKKNFKLLDENLVKINVTLKKNIFMQTFKFFAKYHIDKLIKLVRVVAVQDMFRKFVQKKGQTKTRHHTNLSENSRYVQKQKKVSMESSTTFSQIRAIFFYLSMNLLKNSKCCMKILSKCHVEKN